MLIMLVWGLHFENYHDILLPAKDDLVNQKTLKTCYYFKIYIFKKTQQGGENSRMDHWVFTPQQGHLFECMSCVYRAPPLKDLMLCLMLSFTVLKFLIISQQGGLHFYFANYNSQSSLPMLIIFNVVKILAILISKILLKTYYVPTILPRGGIQGQGRILLSSIDKIARYSK